MEPTSSLRLGIVGAGHIASVHCRHAKNIPGVTVAAIADSQLDRAETLAKTVGTAAFDSADALFADETIDAVVVAVPTAQHKTVVESALVAGKHVFCEKPFALTVADCDTLIVAAKTAGKTLTIGQVARFFPEYAKAKALVDSGSVGKVAAVRTRRAGRFPAAAWFADTAQSGGILLDLLVHDFDFLQWCFGPVVRVHARTLTAKQLPIDYALVTLRHASGVIAHVEGSWAEPTGFHTAFEIAGDAGLLAHDSRQATPLIRALHTTPTAAATGFNALSAHDDPYFKQLSAFVASVRSGSIPLVSAEDARAAVAVAVAAQESAATGKAVTIGGTNG